MSAKRIVNFAVDVKGIPEIEKLITCVSNLYNISLDRRTNKLHSWGNPMVVFNGNSEYGDAGVVVVEHCTHCDAVRFREWYFRHNMWNALCAVIKYRRLKDKPLHQRKIVSLQMLDISLEISPILSLDENKYILKEKEMQRNLEILKISKGKRRDAAIYRLYRCFDYPLNQIAEICGKSRSWVQSRIGLVFSVICISNDNCVFKPYLHSENDS